MAGAASMQGAWQFGVGGFGGRQRKALVATVQGFLNGSAGQAGRGAPHGRRVLPAEGRIVRGLPGGGGGAAGIPSCCSPAW